MPDWPEIADPELLERLAMGNPEFGEYIGALMAQIPERPYDATVLERALGYPWARPEGSFWLEDGAVELLGELTARERDRAIRRGAAAGGRVPLLAIGSNGAPAVLERKFAHFEDRADRSVLALSGRLHGFDVGVAPQPALYGALPATIFPSPGTAVSSAVLWVTPAQFTQLVWSEVSYRLGMLRARFEVEESDTGFDELLVFVSRFGAFCLDGRPVALAAIPAAGRTARALTQEQLLDAAAALAIGPEARAEALVRAIFEDLAGTAPKIAATVHPQALPFESEGWTPFNNPR